jgi:hypothetical protein
MILTDEQIAGSRSIPNGANWAPVGKIDDLASMSVANFETQPTER